MSISQRLYIRWLPEEASEPTSTHVLTTPTRHFVDLRFFLRSDAHSDAAKLLTIEWGFAGRSVGTATHGKWIHEISSRTEHPEDESDEGDIFPHPTLPNIELERGQMRHPDSGKVIEYEEAWKAVPVLPVGGPYDAMHISVRLELRGDEISDKRGAIVRVGQYCQGILRDGANVSAQRWLWSDGSWKRIAQFGDLDIPCDATWETVKEGERIGRGDALWDVMEVSVW
ncbi:hypothetical protein BD414DRAFT_421546 [Trametes punicea]|nr:hypothetical protein BD414DRAFT_421546 [Trametes punicea]